MDNLDYIPNTRRAWHDGYNAGRMHTEAILTDLIAELRETHRMTQDEWHGKKLQDRWCLGCERRDDWAGLTPWPCPSAEAADRAEARLRGLDAPPNPANERINLGGAGDD